MVLLLVGFVSAECGSWQIDINSASLNELDELDGIGPIKAQAIVDERDFDSVDDLIDVDGIGEATLKKILNQDLACVDEEKKDDEKDDERIEDVKKEEIRKNLGEEIILISEEIDDAEIILEEEVVYVSRNRKVMEFLPYIFCFILIVVIGILAWQRF